MTLIWTKSSKPLSVLIRWGLKEPVSHFAIVFDDFLVFHSNLFGVHLETLPKFLKSSQIVFKIDVPLPLEEEEAIYKSIIPIFEGQDYDYKAFLYFNYRGLLWRLFNKPFPPVSPLSTRKDDKQLCTELAFALPSWLLPKELLEADLSILSPYKLYLKFKEHYASSN